MSIPKVLVYKPDLLPRSETFIKEQVLSLRRWHGVLVGHYRVPRGLPLDGLDLRLLMHDPPGLTESLLWRTRRLFGWVSRGEVEQLAAEHAQLLHAHFGTAGVDIWPLAEALGLPMLVTLHGFDITIDPKWWEAGHGGWRRQTYPKQLLAMARQRTVSFLAVSNSIRNHAIQRGIPPEKIAVSYIGVDTSKFQPSYTPIIDRPKRVLFIGRLVEKKGAAHLLRAFASVHRRIPIAELVILGDGPLRSTLELYAQELNIPVQFVGHVEHSELNGFFSKAAILCLPSIVAKSGDAEGFGLVVLEAQASGLPVVTSARGGAQEGLQDGVTGFAIREGDEDALADRIERLLKDEVLLATMSASARAFVCARFDLVRQTEALENHYDEASSVTVAH